jgi:hypothetical protein
MDTVVKFKDVWMDKNAKIIAYETHRSSLFNRLTELVLGVANVPNIP